MLRNLFDFSVRFLSHYPSNKSYSFRNHLLLPTVFQENSCQLSTIMASKAHQGSVWYQKEIQLSPKARGCHLIGEEVHRKMPEIKNIKVGIMHVLIKHTSASLALNENWDPSVRDDTEMFMNKLVPESTPFKHSCEGPDDMPAHLKALFFGSSVTIPITDGKSNLGTWQGLWLCEHRDRGGPRKLVVIGDVKLSESLTFSPQGPESWLLLYKVLQLPETR